MSTQAEDDCRPDSTTAPPGQPPDTDDAEFTEDATDPVQYLLKQRHPRIRLHRETLALLQRLDLSNTPQGLQEFCNEAIRYVVLSREAAMVTFTDLHAVAAALDARLDELGVILLQVHQSVADLTLLAEQNRIIGPYGERLKRLTAEQSGKASMGDQPA